MNFIKTGNPNGSGLPTWPTYDATTNYLRMRIDVESKAEPETDRAPYLVLDAVVVKPQEPFAVAVRGTVTPSGTSSTSSSTSTT